MLLRELSGPSAAFGRYCSQTVAGEAGQRSHLGTFESSERGSIGLCSCIGFVAGFKVLSCKAACLHILNQVRIVSTSEGDIHSIQIHVVLSTNPKIQSMVALSFLLFLLLWWWSAGLQHSLLDT